MKKNRVFALLLAGILAISMGTSVWASTEDEIAYAQEQKRSAENGLAQTEAVISSLEGKKQELENYLAELDAQYEELSESVSDLEAQAAAKEQELAQIKKELKKARKTAKKQYEAMKLRIVYMYENGGSSMLEMLLSCENLADFLNQAVNVSQISRYDREMLKKYEEMRQEIKQQEEKAAQEAEEIQQIKEQKEQKQQEVQAMADNTSANITSYVNQISASRAEAGELMAEINRADNSISALMVKAQEEKAAEEAAALAAMSEEEESQSQSMPDFDPDTDTMDSSSSSTSSNIIVEEEDDEEDLYGSSDGEEDYEDSFEEADESSEAESTEAESTEAESTEAESTEDSAQSSGQGTYLGNFRLTGYCNCAQCCGTAGNATASGAMPTAGHTVAMAGVPFGTQLSINGTIYTVEDLGTPYGHVDIYFDSHEAALGFGSQYADVYQVN